MCLLPRKLNFKNGFVSKGLKNQLVIFRNGFFRPTVGPWWRARRQPQVNGIY